MHVKRTYKAPDNSLFNNFFIMHDVKRTYKVTKSLSEGIRGLSGNVQPVPSAGKHLTAAKHRKANVSEPRLLFFLVENRKISYSVLGDVPRINFKADRISQQTQKKSNKHGNLRSSFKKAN